MVTKWIVLAILVNIIAIKSKTMVLSSVFPAPKEQEIFLPKSLFGKFCPHEPNERAPPQYLWYEPK